MGPKASHHSDLSALPNSEPKHLEHVSNFVHSLVTLEFDPLMLEQAKANPDWPQWHIALQANTHPSENIKFLAPLSLSWLLNLLATS